MSTRLEGKGYAEGSRSSILACPQAFVRGILANWLVCIALWMATSSSSLPGKILGAYFPILTFVGIGFEHSVANMFFIPMARTLPGLHFAFVPVTIGHRHITRETRGRSDDMAMRRALLRATTSLCQKQCRLHKAVPRCSRSAKLLGRPG